MLLRIFQSTPEVPPHLYDINLHDRQLSKQIKPNVELGYQVFKSCNTTFSRLSNHQFVTCLSININNLHMIASLLLYKITACWIYIICSLGSESPLNIMNASLLVDTLASLIHLMNKEFHISPVIWAISLSTSTLLDEYLSIHYPMIVFKSSSIPFIFFRDLEECSGLGLSLVRLFVFNCQSTTSSSHSFESCLERLSMCQRAFKIFSVSSCYLSCPSIFGPIS